MERKKINLMNNKGWIGGYNQSILSKFGWSSSSVLGNAGQWPGLKQISPTMLMACQRRVERHTLWKSTERRILGWAGTVYSSKTYSSDKSLLLPWGAGKNFWMWQYISEILIGWGRLQGAQSIHSRRKDVKTEPLRWRVACIQQTEKLR